MRSSSSLFISSHLTSPHLFISHSIHLFICIQSRRTNNTRTTDYCCPSSHLQFFVTFGCSSPSPLSILALTTCHRFVQLPEPLLQVVSELSSYCIKFAKMTIGGILRICKSANCTLLRHLRGARSSRHHRHYYNLTSLKIKMRWWSVVVALTIILSDLDPTA